MAAAVWMTISIAVVTDRYTGRISSLVNAKTPLLPLHHILFFPGRQFRDVDLVIDTPKTPVSMVRISILGRLAH
jgi:hypothetical protein